MHFLQIWVNPETSRLTPAYFTRLVQAPLYSDNSNASNLRIPCPAYRHFTDAEKQDTLVRIVAPLKSDGVSVQREGTGPTPIHAQLSAYASIISPSSTVTHTFSLPVEGKEERKAYIHVIQTSGYNTGRAQGAKVRLNGGLELGEGDGAFVSAKETDKLEVENVGEGSVEIVLFEME